MVDTTYHQELRELKDDVFCLAFELETLAGIVTQGILERWVPGYTAGIVDIEHAARYRWVSQYVNDKRVLDISCGAGRGSYILAEEGKAKEVLACDIDPKVIKYASIRNRHERVTFDVRDAEGFTTNRLFDVIVSFETIEHLANVDTYLQHMQDSLADNGSFFVSTPISAMDLDEHCGNPYHIREWGFLEFQKIMARHFRIEQVYVQLHPVKMAELKQHLGSFMYPLKLSHLSYLSRVIAGRIDTKLLNRGKQADLPYTEILKPVIWNPDICPIAALGKIIFGFQILQCKKP